MRIATVALVLDRGPDCRETLLWVVGSGREGGAVTCAISALTLLCLDDFLTGRWDESARLVEEGVKLCERRGYRLLVAPLRLGQALLAAARGDPDTTRALTDEVIGWAAPGGSATRWSARQWSTSQRAASAAERTVR